MSLVSAYILFYYNEFLYFWGQIVIYKHEKYQDIFFCILRFTFSASKLQNYPAYVWLICMGRMGTFRSLFGTFSSDLEKIHLINHKYHKMS
jgi:hypothetical protein